VATAPKPLLQLIQAGARLVGRHYARLFVRIHMHGFFLSGFHGRFSAFAHGAASCFFALKSLKCFSASFFRIKNAGDCVSLVPNGELQSSKQTQFPKEEFVFSGRPTLKRWGL
jgi:hypothetical protein